jgi:putative phosphonate transport system ATP-binding protein
MNTALLKADNLSRFYGSQVGCQEVSLEVFPGEVIGVVGESGSGKSTLLRLLAALIEPDSGSVGYLDDTGQLNDLNTIPESKKRKLRRTEMGFVYQNPRDGLNMTVSAGANIAERLLTAGERSYKAVRAEALTWLTKVEIDPQRLDDRPEQYSGGMLQRLQIAKNLASRPKLIFLDEPTGGLDVSVQAKLLDLLRRLTSNLGLACVLVTHDLAVARLLSHRLLVMKNGRVIESGLADQVLDDPMEPYTQLLISSTLEV